MKRRKGKLPIFDILLTSLTIILVLASVYSLYLYKNNSTAAHINANDPDEIESTIDEVDTNFPGIKIVTEISNDMNIPFAIQYPQSNYTPFNDKVKKSIKGLKHEHLTNIATYKEKNKDFKNELNISFETFEHPNGTYSFVFTTNEYIGSLQEMIDIQTFHLNNETEEMPTLEDILDHNSESLQTLATIAAKYLEEDDASQNGLTQEKIELYTAPIWENYQSFAFDEEALNLYFPHDKNNDNSPMISIPYDEINDLFIDSYQVELADASAKKKSPTNSNNPPADDSTDGTAKGDNREQEAPTTKRVALTFDDGPDPDVTTRILETLKKYDAKATFFMLGSRVEYYPEIAKMVQESGHELGNHSWTHPDLTKASGEKVYDEIHRTSKIIEEVTGEKPYSFRPPYGAFNDFVMEQADLPIALWDVDTLDWQHRNSQQLLASVQDSVREDSIILMHDIHPSTADGLDAVMAYLQDNGYTFVTVSDIVQQ